MQLYYKGQADIIIHQKQLKEGEYTPTLELGSDFCPVPYAGFGAHWSFLWVDLTLLKTNLSKNK